MKRIIFFLISFLLAQYAFAQRKNMEVIKLDTINVMGRIIAGDGSGISNVNILTTSQDIRFRGLNYTVKTDDHGSFTLLGVKPIDTLSFFALGRKHVFINKGSRILNITIWPEAVKIDDSTRKITVIGQKHHRSPKEFKRLRDSVNVHNIIRDASYPGGIKKFFAFLNDHIKYPALALENSVEGVVTVDFTVAKDGRVVLAKIIKGLNTYCDSAVIEALGKSRRWVPAIVFGKAMDSNFQIDIEFKLSGKSYSRHDLPVSIKN